MGDETGRTDPRPDEGGADPRPGEDDEVKRRAKRWAGGVALAVFAALVLLVLLDLWVNRSASERAFIARNVACLRCHTEMLARLDDESLHRPFERKHCTSCHEEHGKRSAQAVRAGDYSAWRWLRDTLRRLALEVVWRVIAGPALVGERARPPAAESPGEKPSAAGFVASQDRLCWTCHGDLGVGLSSAVVHEPFAEGRCASCHDPHSSPESGLLRGGIEDVCVSCHRIGPELLAAEVHLPFSRRDCTSCHSPHSSEHAGMLVAEQRSLCFGCHGDVEKLLGESVRHEPFETGECTGCHRPHSAGFAPLIASPLPELCYGCHGDVEPRFALASSHPVPGELNCDDCHRPHASGHDGLLPVAQRPLCLGCHDSVRADLALATIHDPVRDDPCASDCHVPHGSDAAPLLEAATPGLCYRCHPDKPPRATPGRSVAAAESLGARRYGRMGPRVSEEEADAMAFPDGRLEGVDPITLPRRGSIRLPPVATHPLGGSTGVTCGSCHEAHASEHETLFVDAPDPLCAGCHTGTVPAFSSSAHAAVSCVRCHSAHSPEYAPLVAEGNPRLCAGCHGDYVAANRHPATPDYYDDHAGEPLTCTSTCHDPHGSRYVRMLRIPYRSSGYGSDYICLVCHTQVGVKY